MDSTTLVKYLETNGFRRVSFLSADKIRESDKLSEIISPGFHAVLCAFPYDFAPPHDLSAENDPHGLIEPFARRHYYREAVSRMKSVLETAFAGFFEPARFRFSAIPVFPKRIWLF